ncbi:CARDB domain-containing protein [Natrialbaceae archaeon AArc-T1-2]|uniref:CARDB domain-containing protein n=1 Tax=Natrialbaceae archaeon AArc-T1-2 TaxID=3053904 RepID=UPI00255B2445|nr:CARDB domain-containing protein [Natrialbaceae archaeon AArc-T1-2]WIV65760.1 CARDB domain-containing protein [Natrialbaceae archaeon AArc-T1-2]
MPSTKILLTAATICFLLALAVPTAAITVGEDPASDEVVLEPVDDDYVTLEDGELELAFGALNDDAETTFADVFTITVGEDADDLEEIWIDHDVDGVAFYADGSEVTNDSRLEPAPGDTVTVGVAVDTHVADAGTETFTVHVLSEDDEEPESDDGAGGGTRDGASAASIEATDLEVTPTDPLVGDDLEVTATYRNAGGESGTVVAELTVDGIVVDRESVTIAPREVETVTFERTLDEPGAVGLEVDGKAETVDVAEDGPALVLSDAAVDAAELEPGEPVVVEATYENEGDRAGEATAEFAVGGTVVDTQTLALEPDEETTVSFEWVLEEPGTYELAVDGTVAGTVTVSDDEEITVVDRELSTSTAAAVAPPLAAGLLFLAPIAKRHRAVWDPTWTDPKSE